MDRDRAIELIRSSALFDAQWYLRINEDVAAAGRDPAVHYHDDGAREERDPGPDFSTTYYLDRYPDVRSSGLNPLFHYITIGAGEERTTKPDIYWNFSRDPDSLSLRNLVATSGLFDEDWYTKKYLKDFVTPPDPIAHYLLEGYKTNYQPGPNFDAHFYLEQYRDIADARINPLVHYITAGKFEGRLPIEPTPTLSEYIMEWNPQRKPIRIYEDNSGKRNIFLVTDSLNRKSFFGGVGTAMLLATAMSKRLDADLTALVRDDETDMSLYRSLVDCHGVVPPNKSVSIINFERPSGVVPYNKHSIFLTTSWWTTRSLLNSIPPEQIIYLIQEDERMFYPHGNLHLNATEVFLNDKIRFVVNTKLLYDHFLRSPDNNVASSSLWFEPAFPINSYYCNGRKGSNRQFLFYARPKTDRNLFVRGLEVIEESILKGYLDQSWTYVFVGANIPKLVLPRGCSYEAVENVNWQTYLEYVRRTDLALSLMYTPHPSYPPLDVVACGGVVVTNQFGNKISLNRYSENLICRPVDVPSLVDGIRQGVGLALDYQTREHNFAAQKLNRNWEVSFADVLEKLCGTGEDRREHYG